MTGKCQKCGESFLCDAIMLDGKPLVMPTLCRSCNAAEEERSKSNEQGRERAERERAWESICPPLYRDSDSRQLAPQQLATVMKWQLGPRGLLLVGKPSTGKTRIAWLLVKRLVMNGTHVRAFDAVSFGREISTRFAIGDGIAETWLESVEQSPVVFFDDFGKMKFTERVESELFGVVERRIANLRPIIATMNFGPGGMVSKMSGDRGPAMVRRLREFCQIVKF